MKTGIAAACAALLLAAAGPCVHAQSIRSLVNGGNDLYKEQKFTDAEVNYRKALEKEKGLVQGYFNLGDALHKQGKYDEAVKQFDIAREKAAQPETRAYAYYNIGNSLMKEQKYQDAVGSYIESLKLNPRDPETKYNLSYALEKLKQQQQQNQQQKQQNKNDKNKDKNNKQNQKDKQDQQNKQNQDQKKQDQQNQQNQQNQNQQQNPQQQEKKMSKADAQRILDVLKNNEKDVQKKLRARQAVRPKTDKDW